MSEKDVRMASSSPCPPNGKHASTGAPPRRLWSQSLPHAPPLPPPALPQSSCSAACSSYKEGVPTAIAHGEERAVSNGVAPSPSPSAAALLVPTPPLTLST
eukprot:scaffold5953_cov107-Isochrysis_galbana.AAC.3